MVPAPTIPPTLYSDLAGIDSVIITSVLSVGIATAIFASPITYKSEIGAELPRSHQ